MSDALKRTSRGSPRPKLDHEPPKKGLVGAAAHATVCRICALCFVLCDVGKEGVAHNLWLMLLITNVVCLSASASASLFYCCRHSHCHVRFTAVPSMGSPLMLRSATASHTQLSWCVQHPTCISCPPLLPYSQLSHLLSPSLSHTHASFSFLPLTSNPPPLSLLVRTRRVPLTCLPLHRHVLEQAMLQVLYVRGPAMMGIFRRNAHARLVECDCLWLSVRDGAHKPRLTNRLCARG